MNEPRRPLPDRLHVCPHCRRVIDSPRVCTGVGSRLHPAAKTIPYRQEK